MTLRIAILGATSHIAKGLIAAWSERDDRQLLLFARFPERVKQFTDQIGKKTCVIGDVSEFGTHAYDVIINCIGIADPGKLIYEAATIFSTTEFWDRRVLEYLANNPESLYINFSSGAVYGGNFSQPVDDTSPAIVPINGLTPSDYYGIAKLHAEARHRAEINKYIVDLRIFSYFSKFIDLSARFLMNDILSALRSGTVLHTTPTPIVRDYVHPDDLVTLIDIIIGKRFLNTVLDVYSVSPVSKNELLNGFANSFGLNFRISENTAAINATGVKHHYYSLSRRAAELGYHPRYSSIDGLYSETTALLA